MENHWIRGWQGIADFFHVQSKKTVQNWHNILAMPILRTPGNVVMAQPKELEQWLKRFEKTHHRKQF